MSDNRGNKKFTPFDKGIKLVSKPNDLDPFDDDPGVLRAVLSCGHVTDPLSLIDSCRAQLNDGSTEFRCPVSGCNKQWPYDEVRKLAKLTVEEQLSFEDQLGTNTVKKEVRFRECPGCGSFIVRSDVFNLSVECSVCTVNFGRIYEFCWQCEREWRGPRPRADRCDNVDCKSGDEELLRDCPIITLKCGVQCPKLRKCPWCGVLIEHDTTGCNNMKCPKCLKEFCFICLKSGHGFNSCNPCTLAPRQTNTVS